jgi:hypothetical protein
MYEQVVHELIATTEASFLVCSTTGAHFCALTNEFRTTHSRFVSFVVIFQIKAGQALRCRPAGDSSSEPAQAEPRGGCRRVCIFAGLS